MNKGFYVIYNIKMLNYFTNKTIIENRIDHISLEFTNKELIDFISWLDNLSFKI